MKNSLKESSRVASRILAEFKAWLEEQDLNSAPYYGNAKALLQNYERGPLKDFILSYGNGKSRSYRSQMRRLIEFLTVRGIESVTNDLEPKVEPEAVPIIKCFLSDIGMRLQGNYSAATYSRVLSHYLSFLHGNLSVIGVRSAQQFLLFRPLSFGTRQLYKSILRSFCIWALDIKALPKKRLTKKQVEILSELKQMSARALSQIISIDVRGSKKLAGVSRITLSYKERNRLLDTCREPEHRAIITLLAWNGLRAAEIARLTVQDCDLKANLVSILSNGSFHKVILFKTPRAEIKRYLSETNRKKGKMFPDLNRQQIDRIAAKYLKNVRNVDSRPKYAQVNLRNTAGRRMVDLGVRLDDVQKTLRLSSLERVKPFVGEKEEYLARMPVDI